MKKELKQEIIRYVEMGLPVFPVRGKVPPKGFEWRKYQNELPTTIEIEEWDKKYTDTEITGIAIALGKVSGMMAIDCDIKNPNKRADQEIINRLKKEGHPETITGSLGSHFFVKYDPSLGFTSNTDVLSGIDIKAQGGYIILPPSTALYGQDELEYSRYNGNKYAWVKEYKKTEELKPFPAWLLDLIKAKTPNPKAKLATVLQGVSKGERNNSAAQVVGKVLFGLKVEDWESVGWQLVEGWNQKNTPPLPESELRSVFNSIQQRQLQNRQTKQNKKSQAITVCFADIKPEPISWLWPGLIPRGKITLIAGDPGLGKSLLGSTLAATVSKGKNWPLTESPSPIGDVIILSAEDDSADTIRPRLDVAGADCNRIHTLKSIQETADNGETTQRMFSFKRDILALEKLLASFPDCKLVVIDPVSAYLDGTDGNGNSDIRGLLGPLAELAAKYKVAVVMIQHLNKSGGGNALYRPMGSLAFIAAARAAFIVTKDQDNPQRRLFMPAKNNLAKESSGLAYSIANTDNHAPVIVWELEPVTITADEALTASQASIESTVTGFATTFLKDLLSVGPISAQEAFKEGMKIGITEKQLRLAREKLKVEPVKAGFDKGWVWALPKMP